LERVVAIVELEPPVGPGGVSGLVEVELHG
jgi:hypothetical protein